MSLFKAAFCRTFLGIKGDQAAGPSAAELSEGFIMTSGISTEELANPAGDYSLGVGTFGMFNNEDWTSMVIADLAGNNCCPLVLASAAIKSNDKQGPFHGGYQESHKSKYIVPRRVTAFYRVDSCLPQQAIVHIGDTNFTGAVAGGVEDFDSGTLAGGTGYTDPGAGPVPTTGGTGTGLTVSYVTDGAGVITSISIVNPGSGYTVGDTITVDDGNTDATIDIEAVTTAAGVNANCCKEFLCDETYYLRIDLKGESVLRFANHNTYQTFDAYGGCCDGPVPTVIDSTLIFMQWATAIRDNNYFKDYLKPVVFDESGVPWFATSADAVAAGWPDTQIFENYVSPGHQEGTCAGMRLMGAYVSTQFKDCTFDLTDHYEIEPVLIFASEVDYTGDPCTFNGLCVVTECPGRQGQGFGESVIRELLLSESYLQNKFHTNKRIREITQGDQYLEQIDRIGGYYTRYFIQHNVPQNANNSQTYSNQQYLLEIITQAPSTGFEAFMAAWLDDCGDCTTLSTEGCTDCTPVAIPTP